MSQPSIQSRLKELGHDVDKERVEPRFDHDANLGIMVDEDTVIFFGTESANARIEADNNVILGDHE